MSEHYCRNWFIVGTQADRNVRAPVHEKPDFRLNGRRFALDFLEDSGRNSGMPQHLSRREFVKSSVWKDDAALEAGAFHWAPFAKCFKGIPNSRVSFDLLNFILALLLCAEQGWAASLTLVDQGIQVGAGNAGQLVISFPNLVSDQQDKTYKPIEHSVKGPEAVLKYEGGGTVTVRKAADDTISFEGQELPADARKLRVEMFIDFSFNEGGTWQTDGGQLTPFPKQKPEKPFLFQGNNTALTLTTAQGRTLAFRLPAYTYQQLQDNREWNWAIYQWSAFMPFDPANPRLMLNITDAVAAGGEKRVIVADRFGQDRELKFPGKVTNESELKSDVAADESYYGNLHPRVTDTYGGLPGSGEKYGLKRTGFFHAERAGGKDVLVNPEGNVTFHLGICGFQPGDDYTYFEGRESAFEWLPPHESAYKSAFGPDSWWGQRAFSFYVANVIRKYGQPYNQEEWVARIIPRVRKWGFNSAGAFSSITDTQRRARLPYVRFLPLGAGEVGGEIKGLRGLFDPFDSGVIAKTDKVFAERVGPQASDPLIVGYFLANEQPFEDIPRIIPTLTGGEAAKLRLAKLLKQKYRTIAAFNRAWGMQIADFGELERAGLPVTTPEAAADLHDFTGRFITEYYQRIAETFHKYDTNHLLIGNRWQPGTANDEQLCRIAGQYMDVISVNYYTYGLDEAFLNRLHSWSGGKPMMLSEYYWSSASDSGLPGGKQVKSQRERGLAYRNYVEQAAALGYVVGIEWFTLIDQARTGRFFEKYTGERANTGLLNVADRPYKDCLAEMSTANYRIYDVLLAGEKPFRYDNPLFSDTGTATRMVNIPRAAGTIRLDGWRDGWPGIPPERIPSSRLVEGADAQGVEGVFRLCWDDANLYLLVEVSDPTPMKNVNRGDSIWAGDGVELFIGHEQVDQPGTLLFSDRQVLLSAGNVDGQAQSFIAHAPKQIPLRLAVMANVNGGGYTLEAAIPFAALGFEPKEGQKLAFDLAIDNSNDGSTRAGQLVWNGTARDSADRTHWGRAVLAK